MSQQIQLNEIARILLLVGGILLIIGALLGLFDLGGFLDLNPGIGNIGRVGSAVMGIIVGVLAVLGSRQVSNLTWSIVLLILGLVVGSLGGMLLVIGSLIGIVATLVKQ